MAKYLTVDGLRTVVSSFKNVIDTNRAECETTITEGLANKVDAEEGKGLISTVDAAKIAKLTVSEAGVISVDNIPAAALERCVVVNSLEAMYALTTDQVQLGDTVKVKPADGGATMYMVVDEANLANENGYEEYVASADWASVSNVPEKVKTPTTLKIQLNGVDLVSYNGHEEAEVVANIRSDSIGIEEVSEAEITAIFNEFFPADAASATTETADAASATTETGDVTGADGTNTGSDV